MPIDPDDELEEIKRLIGEGSYDTPPDPEPPGGDKTAPGGLGAPKKPEPAKQVSGLPAVRQRPGTPQTRQAPGAPAKPKTQEPGEQISGVPAIRRKPGLPQPGQAPGKPAVQQKPGLPQTRQGPATPATQQKRQPPGQPRRAMPPAASGDPERIRSYDISPDGKITRSHDEEPELDMGSDKFKVNFDFDEAYRDVPENRPLRLRRERRTGCVGGIMYSAFVICISLVLAALLWMATVDVLGFGEDDEQVNVIVKHEFSVEDITEMLYESGLIKYKFLFGWYAGFSNAEDKITPGTYVLNKNFDYRALVQGMTARAGVRVETTVTIPEGFTLAQIFTLLEDYGVCLEADLWETATNHDFKFHFLDEDTLGDRLRLEGFMFPDTYNFYIDSTPVQAIIKFLREFDRRFTDEYIDRAEALGYSIHDIINIAAMIEREAGSDEERPRIAAVIYNRLNSRDFPFLQIDATIFYAIAGTGIPFSIEYDHPFNTYLNEDLPPGPIANPGILSIRAALYPDSTNEYYYALNRQGTHNFFRTGAQHRAFVQSAEYGGR